MIKLKYFSIIFSVIGITILYLISTLTHPALIELNDISKYDGKQVTTTGIVTNNYQTKHGSQIITIEDKNTSIIVFLEGNIPLEYGDKIQVTGTVQKYKDGWEITPSTTRSIKIIEKWENISIPLKQITQNPYVYAGLNVNISGYVDAIYDDYFYLSDEKGDYFLTIFYDDYEKLLHHGQNINVSGLFDYDKENFRYILTLKSEKHKITFKKSS